jgi:hypothetical protein
MIEAVPHDFPVSTGEQSAENQRRELEAVAGDRRRLRRPGHLWRQWPGQAPAIDRMLRDAVRGKFDILAAWAVDRLGRSLQELVATLGELLGELALDRIDAVEAAALEFARLEQAENHLRFGLDRPRPAPFPADSRNGVSRSRSPTTPPAGVPDDPTRPGTARARPPTCYGDARRPRSGQPRHQRESNGH